MANSDNLLSFNVSKMPEEDLNTLNKNIKEGLFEIYLVGRNSDGIILYIKDNRVK